MKSPPPWPLQNKSFPPTPCSLNFSDFRSLLSFLLLCNQGVQSQPPDFNNNWGGAGRSKPDGVGVAEGGGVDFLPGKRFRETTNSLHLQNELASQLGGIFSCAAIVLYSPRTENTRKIAANFQNEYKSGMQNFPCVGTPGPDRNTALGRNSNAVASF